MAPPDPPKRPIGFITPEDKGSKTQDLTLAIRSQSVTLAIRGQAHAVEDGSRATRQGNDHDEATQQQQARSARRSRQIDQGPHQRPLSFSAAFSSYPRTALVGVGQVAVPTLWRHLVAAIVVVDVDMNSSVTTRSRPR